jgi:hypothetical protein
MTIWFYKKIGSKKIYCSKSITINFHIKYFFKFKCYTNGAKKGNIKDICFDLNIHLFGILLSYTNWDYNSEYKIDNIKTIRLKKLKKLKKINDRNK